MCSSPAWSIGIGGKSPTAPRTSNGVEAEVYLSSGVDDHSTDISLVLEQFPIATPEAAARFAAPPKEGFTIAPALVQPTSRGQVRLASANWRDAPMIKANYLGTDHDVNAIVRAIEAARELGRQSAFDQMREAEVVPGPHAASRQDMIDLASTASASFGHAVGTAKIGADTNAVVDSKLRVHGLRGLRVADASVMPFIFSGPGTNAASYMIGGRAAELIKADV
jgi:choline dehydrogenase